MALPIEERVRNSALTHLTTEGHVSTIDVLRGSGWLDQSHFFDWVDGRVPLLESVLSANPTRIVTALQTFAEWGKSSGLRRREAVYFSRTRHPRQLCFTDNPERQLLYSSRYYASHLSGDEVDRLQKSLSLPPELVVFDILKDSACRACGREIPARNLLFMEAGRPLCLKCAELEDLVYLAAGNAKLTRRARRLSAISAVVLRFSRARKRYERKGLLLDEKAVDEAEAELATRIEPKHGLSGNLKPSANGAAWH